MTELLDRIKSLDSLSELGNKSEVCEQKIDRDMLPACFLQRGDELWPTDRDEALSVYIQGIKVARQIGAWVDESSLYYRLLEHLFVEKHYAEARALSEMASLRAQEVEDWNEAAQFTLWAVRAWFKEKRKMELIPPLQNSKKYFRKIDDPSVALELLDMYIDANYLSGQLFEVVAYSEEYLSLVRAVGSPDQEIGHYRLLTTSDLGLGQVESAREAAEKMLALSRHHSFSELEISALNLLSGVEIALGNHDSALIHANQALSIAEELENDELILECLVEGAQIRNSMGLSYEGTKIASDGLRRAIEQKNHEFVTQFLVLLRNYGEVADTVWAELTRLGSESLSMIREGGDPGQLTRSLSDLGELHLEREPQTALSYLLELEALYEKQGEYQLMLSVCRSIATAYSNLNMYHEAVRSLHKAQALLSQYKLGNKWQRLMVSIELSEIYRRAGEIEKSFDVLEGVEVELDRDSLEAMSWAITYHLMELKGNLWMSRKDYRLAEMAFEDALSRLESRFYLAASQEIRLSIQHATAKLSQLLIKACLPQFAPGDGNNNVSRRAFRYTELFRSRLLLIHLGQAVLHPPSNVPDRYLNYEKALIAEMQAYTMNRDSLGFEELSRQLDCWEKLQGLWDEMMKLGDSAHQYISLRRGDVVEYDSLRQVLESAENGR